MPACSRVSTTFKAAAGEELGTSDWVTITQEQINAFADATGDHQWIHVDPERAAKGPFGGTIAHGYLTLSLLPAFAEQHLRRSRAWRSGSTTAPTSCASRARSRSTHACAATATLKETSDIAIGTQVVDLLRDRDRGRREAGAASPTSSTSWRRPEMDFAFDAETQD